MKKLLLTGLLTLITVSTSNAADPMDSLGRFIKSQQLLMGTSFSPLDVKDPQMSAVVLLRGPAFGEHGLSLIPDKHKAGAKEYFEIDYGGSFTKEDVKFRILLGLHPANISNLLLKNVIKTDRLRIPMLPEDIVGGPMFRIPLPGDPEPWTWKNGFRIVFSYLFGKGKEDK